MAKAFISYTREDKTFVDQHVRPILNALNIGVWIDTEELHGAERWREQIQRALPECDYFLAIVTTSAAASPAVRGEVEWILKNREERLIPILAERVRLDGIHPELPQIQHIDCVDQSRNRSASLIARALFHLADRRAKKFEKQKLDLSELLERKQEELDELEQELKSNTSQLDQVTAFEGDWKRPPLGEVAPFVPRAERSAPIIAVMNVKGGVGKSTLSANLAATWWGRAKDPKRVLLVDLDFQQSVTSLCISARDLMDLHSANLFVNELFDEKTPAREHLLRSMRRVGRGEGYVLAASENLSAVETRTMAYWLAHRTQKDLRYLLRELLHGPAVQERFDLVLIDCPPRIHTASINALAAADFLLVPVLLDLMSASSVPRMLSWAREYAKAGICPQLEILGVVANKKSNRRHALLSREDNLWSELPGKCRLAWGGEVPFCETVVPDSSVIAECSQTPGRFACEDASLKPIFEELTRGFEQQMESSVELLA